MVSVTLHLAAYENVKMQSLYENREKQGFVMVSAGRTTHLQTASTVVALL